MKDRIKIGDLVLREKEFGIVLFKDEMGNPFTSSWTIEWVGGYRSSIVEKYVLKYRKDILKAIDETRNI